MRIELTVNGQRQEADVWEGESLLFALRERLGLPGSKNACEQGECGSCSVLLDGSLVCACLVLAAQAGGHEVVTVEGLSNGDGLHPVQEAFVEAGAVQCGFCTPGLVVAAAELLRQNADPSDDEAGRAEAALHGARLDERLLHGARIVAFREPFDGNDFMPVGLCGEDEARAHERAVEQHRARAALALLACVFRPRVAELLAQSEEERLPLPAVGRGVSAVHSQRHPHAIVLSSARAVRTRSAWRR